MSRLIGAAVVIGLAQLAAAQGPPQGPQVVSPEVGNDHRITMRILAPQAQSVRLNATDIPGNGQAAQLTKGANGVWEITTPSVPAGAYRYSFMIDGVATMDPRNPATSESYNNSWSLVYVPGSDVADTKNVVHGSIAEVTYYSTALSAFRRMHVYTPPGYETSSKKYPVFYLLHGAGDSDDSWSTVGRAGFILDNLIAAKTAKPMILVMPAGHVRAISGTALQASGSDPFINDFVAAVMPYVQSHYRVVADRANTAIAGLSMGGGQALNVAMANLDRFGYIGVYSSGVPDTLPSLGRATSGAPVSVRAEWESRNAATLDNTGVKRGLRLLWFATGKDDFVLETTTGTVALFKKHGFSPVFKQSAGGHTWLNWRDYLSEFAPMLFQ